MGLLRQAVTALRTRQAPQLVLDKYGNRNNLLDLWPRIKTYTDRWLDPDAALAITAVYRAVGIIASSIGMLPPVVYEVDRQGARVVVRDERERVIWNKPNPEVSRAVFWETMVAHAVLTGNAFMYVVPFEGTRQAAQLWPVEPRRVKVGRAQDGHKVYQVDHDKVQRDWVDGGAIVHVTGLSTDGIVGLSPIRLAAQALGLALAGEEYAGRFFGQGSHVDGYLTSDQKLTATQAEELSAAWEEHHKGLSNAHRPAVLGLGTAWKQLPINPEDAQMIETRKFQVAEIARMFGVPPHLLGDVERSTSWGSGIEEQSRGFLTFTLQPWLTRFEQTISDELLKPTDHICQFDTTPLVRGKLMDQVNALGALIRAGFVPEAAVKAVGMDPIEHTGLVPVTVKEEEPTPKESPVGV